MPIYSEKHIQRSVRYGIVDVHGRTASAGLGRPVLAGYAPRVKDLHDSQSPDVEDSQLANESTCRAIEATVQADTKALVVMKAVSNKRGKSWHGRDSAEVKRRQVIHPCSHWLQITTPIAI
jgi:hypothetical protein